MLAILGYRGYPVHLFYFPSLLLYFFNLYMPQFPPESVAYGASCQEEHGVQEACCLLVKTFTG